MNESAKRWIAGGSLSALFGLFLAFVGNDVLEPSPDPLTLELELAHLEGIPTTIEELRATIPPVPPEENAAVEYLELGRLPWSDCPFSAQEHLLFAEGPLDVALASLFLESQLPVFTLVDRAIQKPRCWFDRQWELGEYMVCYELGDLGRLSRMVALKASWLMCLGKDRDAVAEIQKLFAIDRHVRQEPTSHFWGRTRRLGLETLCYWVFLRPDVPMYRAALAEAVRALPIPDLRNAYRANMAMELSYIDLSSSLAGRMRLGHHYPAPPLEEVLAAVFVDRTEAKAQLVRSYRRIWRALGLPPCRRRPEIIAAQRKILDAKCAFPGAYPSSERVGYIHEWAYQADTRAIAERQVFAAFLRAVSNGKIESQIRTDDLRSPFDGTPIRYVYDGTQIAIDVSCPEPFERSSRLRVPPNRFVGRREDG